MLRCAEIDRRRYGNTNTGRGDVGVFGDAGRMSSELLEPGGGVGRLCMSAQMNVAFPVSDLPEVAILEHVGRPGRSEHPGHG